MLVYSFNSIALKLMFTVCSIYRGVGVDTKASIYTQV